MHKFPRFIEYKALFYRILLAYVFYFLARVLFFVYNSDLIKVDGIVDFFRLCYHGIAFDTTSILYINGLFIILSVFPVLVNAKKGYQKFLFYLYFVTNLLAYVFNFADFIYYRFIFGRSTKASLESLENESNKGLLFLSFVIDYWHVFLLFFLTAYVWIRLYKIVKVKEHTEKPNVKWLTDITEFRIPAGKIYLSPIIDCFDGLPVSWTIGTAPDANLVNTMLDEAISILRSDEKPIIHSDRGSHYRWTGWIERMNNNELIRSMSRKGCSPDNSACEGFFGRLKMEMFYGYSWSGVSINQFIEELDKYIKWYAEKRIKISLGGMSPIDYRRSLGLVV